MRPLRALLAGALWAVATGVPAQALRDPAIPEALRSTRPAAPSRGAELQAQVQRKLRARFDAADTGHQGHISRAQAEAAGLGYVVRDFDAIDTAGHGSVSWAQVRAHLGRLERAARAP